MNVPTPVATVAKDNWVDRPAWIPTHITADWDSNPYAYLTEAEQMSAGGPHNQLLAYIMEMLRWFLVQRRLMFLMDVLLLYRDETGRKHVLPLISC